MSDPKTKQAICGGGYSALGPAGVYSGGRLYPLDRGVWSFADANRLPGSTTLGLTVRAPSGRPMLYGLGGPPPRLVQWLS